MQVQKSFKGETAYGKLYLVATPIGNLDDMSLRMVNTLKEVDRIAAEDTRNTGLLLKHFGIETKQISFHEHNAKEKIPVLLDMLQSGNDIAQVSDAGLPSISVVPIPGPSAGITALIASGLAPQPHIFYGFLPRKAGQQKEFFTSKKSYPETQIFYESPHRVRATLENMLAVYGDRQVVLVRELTKIHEEYQRGLISELLAYTAEHPPKGECLLIVAGAAEDALQDISQEQILAEIDLLVEAGSKKNQAIKEVAKKYGRNKSELYALYHELRGS